MGGYGFFFRTTQELEYSFFCRAKREIFFRNLTLDYITKTLNQIIFFFLHQNQNIFFSNIGNQNIFLEKKYNPLQVKWSFPCKKTIINMKVSSGFCYDMYFQYWLSLYKISKNFPIRIKISHGSHSLYNVLLRVNYFYQNNVTHAKTTYKLWL